MRNAVYNILRLVLVATFAIGLSACTEMQFMAAGYKEYNAPSGSKGDFKVGRPYQVQGTTYRPTESYSLDETGISSWYGPGFHGGRTANGEKFDANELTAAHRTLQLPCLVRVTNLENGRSLIVRVNDRGPFARGRIIDVSKRAADLLGFLGKGTAKVRVQVLAEESRQMAEAAKQGKDTRGMEVALNNAPPPLETVPAPQPVVQQASADGTFQTAGLDPVQVETLSAPTPTESTVYSPSGVQGHTTSTGKFYPDPVVKQFPVTPTSIYVQAGSFGNHENAIRVSSALQGLGNVRINPVVVNGQQYFRVQVGPINAVDTADGVLSRVINKGYPEARIMVDSS